MGARWLIRDADHIFGALLPTIYYKILASFLTRLWWRSMLASLAR